MTTATELADQAARMADDQPVIDVAEAPPEPSTAVVPVQAHEAPALIPEHGELTVLAQLAVTFAQAGLVPKAMQGKPADVLLVLMTGRGLGLDPMVALRECHPIDGKVTISPKLKLAIVRERGLGDVWPESGNDDKVATWNAIRHDDRHQTEYHSTFTIADAQRAGLANKDNWKKYPSRMLSWRALGYLMDEAFPEVGTGLYDADSLGAVTDEAGDPVIDVTDVTPLAGIEPKARPGSAPSNANEVCSEDERAAIKARIGALPPPAVQALAERWSKPDPVTGDPTLWPLKILPNRQVKAAHALVDSVEKQAKAGQWGEWVGTGPDRGPGGAVSASEALAGTGGPDEPAEATTGDREPEDADLVCCEPGCDELATVLTDDSEPYCAEHAPMTDGKG